MKVKCISNDSYIVLEDEDIEVEHGLRCSLTIGKIYEVVSIENGDDYYRIIDDTGEDYLFPAYMFEEAERDQTTIK
ncbi:MAG: hypothetical protein AB1422_15000 [bacterium]